MQRRELFSSLFSKEKETKEIVVRPPYFNSEDSFYKECNKCENKPCSTFCQENIIVIAEDNTPKINFTFGGCTYCGECAENCPSEVLKSEYKKLIDVKIEIDIMKCVSWHQTMCFSCKDPCLDEAIEFLGMFRPSIVDDKCTSCGFCVSVCPREAIVIKTEGV